MFMQPATPACRQSLSPSHIAARRLAASTMTGTNRRAFEAERTVPYGRGTPLRADARCGWGRQTVVTHGVAEANLKSRFILDRPKDRRDGWYLGASTTMLPRSKLLDLTRQGEGSRKGTEG